MSIIFSAFATFTLRLLFHPYVVVDRPLRFSSNSMY
nr:MAG TPA: hypothetical protein [Caudoviricetes sp.]